MIKEDAVEQVGPTVKNQSSLSLDINLFISRQILCYYEIVCNLGHKG